jgi:hypothetical protein
MRKKKGYSLWILPQKKISDKLQKIISFNAKKYNFPNFIPHITINNYLNKKNLNDLKIKKIKKIKVHVNDIKKKNYFYYSIFLDIQLKKRLINFHNATRTNSIKCKFAPHLSLIYSNNQNLKKKIFKKIKDNNDFKNLSFFCDKAAFIKFNEIKNKWKIIKMIKLSGV